MGAMIEITSLIGIDRRGKTNITSTPDMGNNTEITIIHDIGGEAKITGTHDLEITSTHGLGGKR